MRAGRTRGTGSCGFGREDAGHVHGELQCSEGEVWGGGEASGRERSVEADIEAMAGENEYETEELR